MKKIILLSVMALVAVVGYGRRHVSADAVLASDTIYYSADRKNVSERAEAHYYRLLLTQGAGADKQDVFRDFYLNGVLKAEGGYKFVDLGNDSNTIFDGEVTTYYPNGMQKVHGKYVNGMRQGHFTVLMEDGRIAVMEFANGRSKHDYFVITSQDGHTEKRPISEIRSLLQ